MRGVLIASLACAVLAMDLTAATQAQAQMGGSPTGFGRGNRRPGGEEEKKPQYVPRTKASETMFPPNGMANGSVRSASAAMW